MVAHCATCARSNNSTPRSGRVRQAFVADPAFHDFLRDPERLRDLDEIQIHAGWRNDGCRQVVNGGMAPRNTHAASAARPTRI